jgi:membrane associated rhomboid family serine protease
MSEDDYEFAHGEWERFRSHPEDPKYRLKPMDFAVVEAAPKEKEKSEEKTRYVRRDVFADEGRPGSVTIAMLAICILLYFTLDNAAMSWLQAKLMFSEYHGRSFPEIRDWQLWRLVTPALMHGGVLHLFFNMWMLYSLGAQIETREGGLYLVVQSIVYAIIVNTAQYLHTGPLFLGMSGVLYGQLGYIWMMSRYSRQFNYFLAPGTVMLMLIWMGLGILGVFSNVANMQHLVGFIIGVISGYIRSGEMSIAIKQYFRKRR